MHGTRYFQIILSFRTRLEVDLLPKFSVPISISRLLRGGKKGTAAQEHFQFLHPLFTILRLIS